MAGQAGGTARNTTEGNENAEIQETELGNPREMKAASGLMKSVGMPGKKSKRKTAGLDFGKRACQRRV